MLSISDINPRRRMPFITFGIIALNVLVFLWTWLLPPEELWELFMRWSIVPVQITANPFSVESLLDVLRSMFFHGGLIHLLGNMPYLYMFGDNVEGRMGIFLYLLLFFFSGIAASTTQILINPASTIPLIGASGAIGGVLGAYLVLFPGVRVRGIIPFGRYGRVAAWPPWVFLGFWFVLQLLYGSVSIFSGSSSGGRVAFFAHVGGFVFGMFYAWIFLRYFPQPPAEERRQALYQRTDRYRF